LLFAAASIDDEKKDGVSNEPAAESSIEIDENDQEDARKHHGQSGRDPSVQRIGCQVMVKIRDHQADARQQQT